MQALNGNGADDGVCHDSGQFFLYQMCPYNDIDNGLFCTELPADLEWQRRLVQL
jgi:hypothetical protein